MRPIVLLLATVFAGASANANAQDIFSDPSNLKVLPEDVSPAELRAKMRLFAMATGSRCESCHVGEAGAPLDTFDFASDDRERKRIAREMMRMTATINETIDGLDPPRSSVTCMTCHRGTEKPRSTVEEMEIAAAGADPAAALARFRELRERYYGSHSYDFTEAVLLTYGERLAPSDPAAAETIVEANLTWFPESLRTWLTLGQLRSATGNAGGARAALDRALELAPDDRTRGWIQSQLNGLAE